MREETSEPAFAIPAEEWGPGYRLWQAIAVLLSQRGPDGTTALVRLASHLLIILVAILVIGVSQLRLPSWEIAEVTGSTAAGQTAELPAEQSRENAITVGSLVRGAVPITLIAERPRTVEPTKYAVQPGDTLYAIADKYGISAETLMWANNMDENPDLLRLGEDLIVLPVSGVLHTAVQGDTAESIAKKYKANPTDVIAFPWNKINPKNPALTVGQQVIVPGGSKPLIVRPAAAFSGKAPAGAARGQGRFIWPASGSITQAYRPLHHAIDSGAPAGAPVKASDGGYVAVAGWSNVGYGNYVIIDHGNGFQTLYGHLSKILVAAGDSVARGAVIGAVGSTGRSTGPHLHFEIRLNGGGYNPFNYLP